MKLIEYMERINLLNKLVKEKKTGTLNELSKRMKLSKSRMCRVMDDLKLKGAPIAYSRKLNSYVYTCNYNIKVEIEFKKLSEDDIIETNGGFDNILNKNKICFSLLFLCNEVQYLSKSKQSQF